jgi:hypothetical protein
LNPRAKRCEADQAVTGRGARFFGTRMKRRAKRTMFGLVVGRRSRLS